MDKGEAPSPIRSVCGHISGTGPTATGRLSAPGVQDTPPGGEKQKFIKTTGVKGRGHARQGEEERPGQQREYPRRQQFPGAGQTQRGTHQCPASERARVLEHTYCQGATGSTARAGSTRWLFSSSSSAPMKYSPTAAGSVKTKSTRTVSRNSPGQAARISRYRAVKSR